ncbi:hypothetical protein DBT_0162 [Dissulfuribacter thermophilus]|uniref:Uncharacterized protein n=1 Tax=Dissulfuribacter thermophilus TaxID=1156395 RepID=A0A1B9F945_9BACT|nr:hypothetical protein DBT_0162 [Dissulfuribacter thermophilus]
MRQRPGQSLGLCLKRWLRPYVFSHILTEEIEEIFDLGYHLEHIDTIF